MLPIYVVTHLHVSLDQGTEAGRGIMRKYLGGRPCQRLHTKDNMQPASRGSSCLLHVSQQKRKKGTLGPRAATICSRAVRQCESVPDSFTRSTRRWECSCRYLTHKFYCIFDTVCSLSYLRIALVSFPVILGTHMSRRGLVPTAITSRISGHVRRSGPGLRYWCLCCRCVLSTARLDTQHRFDIHFADLMSYEGASL